MAIMKSIEVMSESTKSFEDAIQNAVDRTAKTVKDIQSANICLLYTSPSPRDLSTSRMPSSA